MARFMCWGDGYGPEDATPQEAADARQAAERYSEARDQGGTEYPPERVVFVQGAPGEKEVEVYEVTLYMVPEYEARKRRTKEKT